MATALKHGLASLDRESEHPRLFASAFEFEVRDAVAGRSLFEELEMEDGSDVEELETAFPAASEDDVISSKLAIRRRRMDALAAIIGLDEETTSILLRHCGSDEDRMLERYFVDAKGLLREAVIQDTAAVQDFTRDESAAVCWWR